MASSSTPHYEHILACKYPLAELPDCTSYYPGCECTSCCCHASCICMCKSQVTPAKHFYADGALDVSKVPTNFMTPIYECNSNCVCDLNCANRVIQRGGLNCVEVFNTQTKGMGVRTSNPIKSGQFVIEFVGEVIRVTEGRKRLGNLTEKDSCYIMLLKEHAGDLKTFITCIDATLKGNTSRFINHSCQPNLMLLPVRVNSIIPHLCLFSQRDIEIGEELTYDYSGGNDLVVAEKKLTPCLCGSVNCRGFLPLQNV